MLGPNFPILARLRPAPVATPVIEVDDDPATLARLAAIMSDRVLPCPNCGGDPHARAAGRARAAARPAAASRLSRGPHRPLRGRRLPRAARLRGRDGAARLPDRGQPTPDRRDHVRRRPARGHGRGCAGRARWRQRGRRRPALRARAGVGGLGAPWLLARGYSRCPMRRGRSPPGRPPCCAAWSRWAWRWPPRWAMCWRAAPRHASACLPAPRCRCSCSPICSAHIGYNPGHPRRTVLPADAVHDLPGRAGGVGAGGRHGLAANAQYQPRLWPGRPTGI